MGKHLVLVGGGHAHMTVMLNLREYTERGHRVTLIGPSAYHYYSGMGPGLLDEADDVFLTNARVGIWPVAELDGRRYARSELTLRLRRGMVERGVTECAV